MEDDHKNSFEFLENHSSLQELGTTGGSGSSSDRSISGDGKLLQKNLRIKVKFRMPRECCNGDESIIHNQSPEKDEYRACKVCNKRFSSGRALGGHMRLHAQAHESPHILKKNLNSKLKHHYRKFKNHARHLLFPADCKDDNTNNATDAPIINGNSKTNSNNTSCSICGKNFPSMKSLFGHMRCHPERQWRGIKPPPSARNSSSSTVSDCIPRKTDDQIDSATTTAKSAIDLSQSLWSWSATAKRGRKSLASVSCSKEQIPDAVYDLMMLAQGDSLYSALSNKQGSGDPESANNHVQSQSKKAKIENRGDYVSENLEPLKIQRSQESIAENRDLLSNKIKFDDRGLLKSGYEKVEAGNIDFLSKKIACKENCTSKLGFELERFEMGSGWEKTNIFGEDFRQKIMEESENKNTDYSIAGKQFINKSEISKKKKKKMKFRDLETVQGIGMINYKQMPVTSDRYKCTTCNKSFSSHQALGGHRSSHNKGKHGLLIADIGESTFADPSTEEEVQYGAATQVVGSLEFENTQPRMVSTDQCKICSQTFTMGQAINELKICHWTAQVEAPTMSMTSMVEISKVGHGVLDFDLNELPVIEDEEGLESASNQNHSTGIKEPVDYASSSYNSVS